MHPAQENATTALKDDIALNVRNALSEDIGSGDITARLIPEHVPGNAKVITREAGILCGQAWANEVFRQVDPNIELTWLAAEGKAISENDILFTAVGPARSLLTAERAALNFLQLLCGTATLCQHYATLVEGTGVKLLDTRKTIPGLRKAQKYAVSCGGCYNHRMGLYDAFLIKENHINACGGIAAAVNTARTQCPGIPIEVEVENQKELLQALEASCDRVMLDNFSLSELREAVQINAGRVELEAAGIVREKTLREIALTGVDYVSIGALTKDCKAMDLSMRLL